MVYTVNFKRISLKKVDLNVVAFEFARVCVISVEQRVFWVMSFIVHIFSGWLLRVKVHFSLLRCIRCIALLYFLA